MESVLTSRVHSCTFKNDTQLKLSLHNSRFIMFIDVSCVTYIHSIGYKYDKEMSHQFSLLSRTRYGSQTCEMTNSAGVL